MHNDLQFNITVHICNLKNRVKEFVLALEQSKDLEASKVTSWKPPFVGVIKHPLRNLAPFVGVCMVEFIQSYVSFISYQICLYFSN